MIDLQLNYPLLGQEGNILSAFLHSIEPSELQDLLRARPVTGRPADREGGAKFLAGLGLDTSANRVSIISSGHAGLGLILGVAGLAGKPIAVDALTYPNFITIARARGITLLPCTFDSDGMLPASLEAAIEAGALAVYLMPTIHNPLGTVMPAARRRELAAIARRAEVWVIEDDAYAFLEPSSPAPLASWAPERTFYLHSMSKPFAPGLKSALLAVPERFVEEIERAADLNGGGASLIFSSCLTHLFDSGALATLIAAKREEAVRRQRLAGTILNNCRIRSHPTAFHLWIEPERISAEELYERALTHGVKLSSGAAFALCPESSPNAFRLALAGESDLSRLEEGLRIVDGLLQGR